MHGHLVRVRNRDVLCARLVIHSEERTHVFGHIAKVIHPDVGVTMRRIKQDIPKVPEHVHRLLCMCQPAENCGLQLKKGLRSMLSVLYVVAEIPDMVNWVGAHYVCYGRTAFEWGLCRCLQHTSRSLSHRVFYLIASETPRIAHYASNCVENSRDITPRPPLAHPSLCFSVRSVCVVETA